MKRDEISLQTANTANRSRVVTGSSKGTGLQSQFVTSKGRGGRRNLPYAFTEHGAIMVANVLNSPRAIEMSVFVVRAFVRMRGTMANSRALAELKRDLKERLDVHEVAIVDILRRFLEIIDPPPLPEPPRKQIGFRAKGSNGKDKKSKDKRR
jgi:hypothetical protein